MGVVESHSGGTPASRYRALGFDVLEKRQMLAGDAFSAWQNPANAFDVNNDGLVTNNDAHRVIDELRAIGAACMAAPSGEVVNYWDVSGDGPRSA
jgi:hypothetical protein